MGIQLINKVQMFKLKDGSYLPIRDMTDEQFEEAKEFVGNRIDQICHKIDKLQKQTKYYERKNEIYTELWDSFIEEYQRRIHCNSTSNETRSSDKQTSKGTFRISIGASAKRSGDK